MNIPTWDSPQSCDPICNRRSPPTSGLQHQACTRSDIAQVLEARKRKGAGTAGET